MPSRKRKISRGVAAVDAKRIVSFDDFYGSVYGARWPFLRKALTMTVPKKVFMWNRFCQLSFEKVVANMKRVDENLRLQLFEPKNDEEVVSPIKDEFNVKAFYILEYTSALLVEQLGPEAFDNVLDMCASTGGNSIAIAQFLSADATLTANEQRSDRCVRLRRNVRDYVPSNYVPVTVSHRDTETWYDPSRYHRVLVDAPCSVERHLLQQSGGGPVSVRVWSREASFETSRKQRAFLLRALETCRPGGRVVYSTCSISPLENDDVVEYVLQRTRCQVELLSLAFCGAWEKTRYGNILLPDTADGVGPLFCCVMHKVSDRRDESEESDSNEEEEESGGDN